MRWGHHFTWHAGFSYTIFMLLLSYYIWCLGFHMSHMSDAHVCLRWLRFILPWSPWLILWNTVWFTQANASVPLIKHTIEISFILLSSLARGDEKTAFYWIGESYLSRDTPISLAHNLFLWLFLGNMRKIIHYGNWGKLWTWCFGKNLKSVSKNKMCAIQPLIWFLKSNMDFEH